jgi:hypothetical protein
MHARTNVEIKFNKFGEVHHNVHTSSIRLNQFSSFFDYVKIMVYVIYYCLFAYFFYGFMVSVIDKFMKYKKWEKYVVGALSESELKQRHKKKPEFLRIYESVFDNFMIFNVLYFFITLQSVIKYC